jgi:hypothetical protein
VGLVDAAALGMIALLAGACAGSSDGRQRADAPAATSVATVAGPEVVREIEALVCMMTFELPSGPIEEPIFGSREHCKLPPAATPLERAVEQAWKDAGPMLSSMRHESIDEVLAALAETDRDARLAAVRRAYFSPRFLGLIVAHLEPALANEGLRCDGCPPAYVPTPRRIAWDELSPYLERYVWADPVETPRDASGNPTGLPKYGMHICIGLNGIAELDDPDPALIELGFLATFHNEPLRERVGKLFRSLQQEPEFLALHDDFLRVRWLRAELGPRLLAEPAMRDSICETVARFEPDTGLSIAECTR